MLPENPGKVIGVRKPVWKATSFMLSCLARSSFAFYALRQNKSVRRNSQLFFKHFEEIRFAYIGHVCNLIYCEFWCRFFL